LANKTHQNDNPTLASGFDAMLKSRATKYLVYYKFIFHGGCTTKLDRTALETSATGKDPYNL
jgi:hypothetical protein